MRYAPTIAAALGTLLLVAAAWMWNPIAGVAATGLVLTVVGLFVDVQP